MKQINAAILGFGRMGGFFMQEIHANKRWNLKYIYDSYGPSREMAAENAPEAVITDDADVIFNDPSVDVVILSGLAETRLPFIRKAVEKGKHIIAEKPIADSLENEAEVMRLVENSNIISCVDHYLRVAWYHKVIKDFIDSGEIGELAVIRICHMTPGLSPGEGHETEGPSFHDCGMHYMDMARYYAGSEFKTMRSQGVRFWSYKDPWWLQAQGTFENGVVYDVTQSHAYGQLSKDQTHMSYVDILGTKGICRMTHDFKTAHVELRGVTKTEIIDRAHGGKNMDALLLEFEKALDTGDRSGLPQFRDSHIASEMAWKCLEDAWTHDMPAIGTQEELDQIHYRRAHMTDGYGLIRRVQKIVR